MRQIMHSLPIEIFLLELHQKKSVTCTSTKSLNILISFSVDIHTYMHLNLSLYHIYIHTYISTHIHINIYTHIPTNTSTRIHMSSKWVSLKSILNSKQIYISISSKYFIQLYWRKSPTPHWVIVQYITWHQLRILLSL